MAVIKCKMCGGDLNLIEGESVAECEYCGSRQTVPTADNEKKLTLFARANRIRSACEFDKAAGIYESIVAEFPEEAEAYWGLVLCKFGIEYVDDPAIGKKIPTCHRSSFESIMEDSDFEQAQENADVVARRLYREEAKAIEEIRKGIIEVSGREEPYDIFICYKETDENGDRTLDSVLAQELYDALTEKGYRVFFSRITLEDKLGQEYEPYIFAALNSAKIMLAIGTDFEYYNAVWVKNEWSRFLKLMEMGQKKTLIPCYKNLDAYDMPKEFARLQGQDLGKVGAIQDLLRGIEKILPKDGRKAGEQPAVAVSQPGAPGVASLLRRGYLFLEDGEWESADQYFDKVLDIDPENAEAYLGQLLAKRKAHNRDELINHKNTFNKEPLYQKALRFADEDFRTILVQMVEENKRIVERIAEENKRIAEENRRIAEENKRIAEKNKRIAEEKRRRDQERLQKYREHIAPAAKCIAAGRNYVVGLKVDGTVLATGDNTFGQCEVSGWTDIVAIDAGHYHTVGLRSDGRVVRTGGAPEFHFHIDVSSWTDIVAIVNRAYYVVGLRSDGRVLATGDNEYVPDVSGWRDIVAIDDGGSHTVGLRSDGRVVAVGYNRDGRCNVSGWTDIVAIDAGSFHTVGLRSDGRVLATGDNSSGQCDVSGWTDIVAIDVADAHTVGLRSDGRVLATGYHDCIDWTDIVAIASVGFQMVGLRSDGRVVTDGVNSRCDVSGWTDIVAIAAGEFYTVGVRSDGSVVAEYDPCDVSGWKLFQSLDTLEQEREREAAERARKKAGLEQKKKALETELTNLNGLFTGKRRKELETMIAEIEHKLYLLG